MRRLAPKIAVSVRSPRDSYSAPRGTTALSQSRTRSVSPRFLRPFTLAPSSLIPALFPTSPTASLSSFLLTPGSYLFRLFRAIQCLSVANSESSVCTQRGCSSREAKWLLSYFSFNNTTLRNSTGCLSDCSEFDPSLSSLPPLSLRSSRAWAKRSSNCSSLYSSTT